MLNVYLCFEEACISPLSSLMFPAALLPLHLIGLPNISPSFYTCSGTTLHSYSCRKTFLFSFAPTYHLFPSLQMNRPKNPFKKWESVQLKTKIRFYLLTFDHRKIHVATAAQKGLGNMVCYPKNAFLEAYPMILRALGEPYLYSVESIQQWLQTITHISSSAFVKTGTISLWNGIFVRPFIRSYVI